MTKPSRSYYSAAVGHTDIPGAYMASIAMPGELPQWITEGGKPKVFPSAEAAELAGFRVLAKKLNRAQEIQEFHVKQDPARPRRQPAPSQAAQVFRNFR